MKTGEQEAKEILQKCGIEFDESHSDENVGHSIPDLRYKDGRYLEVTHTKHNNYICKGVNKYAKKSLEEKFEIEKKVSLAIKRVHNLDYEKEGEIFSAKSHEQYRKDCKLLKEHMGYNPANQNCPFDEFGCDVPMFHFSADNVIREITDDKGKKYPGEDVDLFIFVAEEEYEYFFNIFNEITCNACAQGHFKALLQSPFPVIYICKWDFFQGDYSNPVLTKLIKTVDGGIEIVSMITAESGTGKFEGEVSCQ